MATMNTVFTSTVASDRARVPILAHHPVHPRGWLVWAHGGSWQHGSASAWAPVTAPLAASSLNGLAPVALVVGEDDPVRDDVTGYADWLRIDGVPVMHTVVPGAGHAELLRCHCEVLRAVAWALSDRALRAPRNRSVHETVTREVRNHS